MRVVRLLALLLLASPAMAEEGAWKFDRSGSAAWLTYGPLDQPRAAFLCTPGVGTVGMLVPVPAEETPTLKPGTETKLALTIGGQTYAFDAGVLQIPNEPGLSVQAFLSASDPVLTALAAVPPGDLTITIAAGQGQALPLAGAQFQALQAACEGNPG